MESHPGFYRYFFNTGWMFGEKILRLVAGVFIGAYVARYLGPGQYGEINYVISLVSLFSVLATLGFDTILIRELIRHEHRQEVLLGTAFILRLAAAILVFAGLYVAVKSTPTETVTAQLIAVISAGMILEIFGLIDFFFQSKVMSRYVVWSQVFSLVVISVFRILLVVYKAPLVWFAWVQLVDLFLIAAGLVFFYQRAGFRIFRWRFEMATARELLRDAWPMIFSSLAITVYLRIDQVMIKWMMGDEATGYYGVAVRLSETWNFIAVVVCASLFPAIVRAKQDNEELYLQRMRYLYALMVALSLAVAIPMTFLSGFIVTLLFGAAYQPAGNVLALYIWSGVFTFLGVANGKWIISENLQVFRMTSLVTAAILNVVLNYFLIRKMGLIGAAVSTLVAYSYAGYFSFLLTKKTRVVFIDMTRSFNLFRLVKQLKLIRNVKP